MTRLLLHKNEINSVFQLLGENENDVTYSIGWAFLKCPSFLRQFLKEITDKSINIDDIEIRLQEHSTGGGYTDIEIELQDELFVLIEAKLGWNLPTKDQLRKYAKRKEFRRSAAKTKKIIILTECNNEYAEYNLNLRKQQIARIPTQSISWERIYRIAENARNRGVNIEKHLYDDELLPYLEGIMTMQDSNSNVVYVVSISNTVPRGWKISYIDVVEKAHHYFHPIDRWWPKIPPNYIGFRYHGQLQSIHKIKKYRIVTNIHKYIKQIPSTNWPLHFLYYLGPAIRPTKIVKLGNLRSNGRYKCTIDSLLTCRTIERARRISNIR